MSIGKNGQINRKKDEGTRTSARIRLDRKMPNPNRPVFIPILHNPEHGEWHPQRSYDQADFVNQVTYPCRDPRRVMATDLGHVAEPYDPLEGVLEEVADLKQQPQCS
jgi:hypothetical protein